MRNIYIRILFLLAATWQYSYAQESVINWPLDQAHITNAVVSDNASVETAALHNQSGTTPVTATFMDDRAGATRQVMVLGDDKYIQMTDFFGTDFSSSPYGVPNNLTITFWLYHSNTDTGRRSIFSGGQGLGIDIEDNTLILKRKESYRAGYSEFPIVESIPVFSEEGGDGWYFIALSYTDYFFKLYMGQKGKAELACSYQWMGSFKQDWTGINRTTDFYIGSKVAPLKSIESVSDFTVFNAALRREQVTNLFIEDSYQAYALQVYKNNVEQSSIIRDALVGDVLRFEVTTNSATKPSIENLPQTWIARFSGDFRYFVDESFSTGKSKPWIGFDTQVHWLNLRNFEQEPGRTNYPDWVTTVVSPGSWKHTLTYVVNTPMKPYTSAPSKYQWDKFSRHKNSSGDYDKNKVLSSDKQVWLQRANQKEGLNMQILHYWNWNNDAWQDANYTSAYPGLPYMMGFDDDEILYANKREYELQSGGYYAILKEPLDWQTVPTKETASGDETVNAVVSAYYQANGEYEQGEKFLGSELLDYNTTDSIPEGTGTWMHQNGNVIITIPGSSGVNFQVGVNAESPLKKFYSIEGPTVVGRNETLDFHLTPFAGVNLKGVIDAYVTSGYEVTLEYETQDSFGSLKRDCAIPAGGGTWESPSGFRTGVCTHQVYSTITANSRNVLGANPFLSMVDNQPLTFKIKAYSDSYHSISLYLVKRNENIRILLAGKEILPVNLAFLEDQNLVNGTGEGGYFFVEQQRNVKTTASSNQANGPFNVPRGDKWTNPFVRTYTFYQDQSSKWKVWDSDPHMLAGDEANPDHDWYQSNKKLALRITDQQIATGQMVKYYFGRIDINDLNGDGYLSPCLLNETPPCDELGSPISTTRFWEVDWSSYSPGVYQLTATFRGGQQIAHKIIIKPSRTVAANPLASVKSYDLAPYDKALLKVGGMNLDDNTDYKVLEIQELSSRLMFLIGERNNYQNNQSGLPNDVTASSSKLNKVNRWGPYNDYNARFYWFSNLGQISTPATFSFIDSDNDWHFGVDDQLSLQDLSDKNYDRQPAERFPTLWGNHFSSLWKSAGPDGQAGPRYLHTAALPDENDSNITAQFAASFNTLDDEDFWQFRATLNSWSDSYGYRMRYNPSHIYDLHRVFDPAKGAFSGAAVPMQYQDDHKSKARQPYPGDNFLNLQAWHYDLKMGRKIIVDVDTYDDIKEEIKLYNDFNVEYSKLGSAGGYASTNKISYHLLPISGGSRQTIPLCISCVVEEAAGPPGARLAAVEAITEIKSDELTPALTVYPNPVDTHDQINIEVTATKLSPLYFAVYDLMGRIIFEESSVVDRGVNLFTLDAKSLGIYTEMVVVKIQTSELNETRKIIVTRSVDKK